MDNQWNGNGWNGNEGQRDRWNSDASHSSYYNQPTHRPYGQAFAVASTVCGLLSVTTICTVVLPLIFGALGLLFAYLSHRSKKRMNTNCVLGMALSSVALVSVVCMTVYSFLSLPTLMRDETFRNQVNSFSRQIYGVDFEEFMEQFYGYTFEE